MHGIHLRRVGLLLVGIAALLGRVPLRGETTISYRQDSLPPLRDITHYAIQYLEGGREDCLESEWHCLGPTGIPKGYTSSKGQGQIHALAFSPQYDRDSILYAGSNFGGLWVKRGQAAWRPLGEGAFPYSSISDIAIDPGNKAHLFVATGDGENMPYHHAINTDDGTSSIFTPLFTSGVFRSLDGGSHWTAINGSNQALLQDFEKGGVIRKLLLDPVRKRLWAISSEGVYLCSTPYAATPEWRRISRSLTALDTDDQLKGIVVHPKHPDTVMISGRDIYRTTDGGIHWSRMTGGGKGSTWEGLPPAFVVDRINLAVSAAAPDRLYAYIVGKEDNTPAYALHMYDGVKWSNLKYATTRSPFELATPTRMAIAISPNHPDTLFYGTTKVYGGNIHHLRPYSPYSGNGFHADVHVLAYEPGGMRLFAGTDGGISAKPVDRGGSGGWQFISDGLQVKTVYRFGAPADRPDRLITGSQDTGTDVYFDGTWTTIEGGDGYNGKVDMVSGVGYASGSSSSNRLFTYDFKHKKKTPEWRRHLLPIDSTEKMEARIKAFQMKHHPITERPWISMTELYERKVHRPARRGDTADSLWIVRSDIGKYIPAQWERQLTEFDISPANPDYIYLIVNGYQKDQPDGFVVQSRLFLSTTGGCRQGQWHRDTCFRDITPALVKSGIRSRYYQPVVLRDKKLRIPVITAVTFAPDDPLKAWITFTGYEPGVKVWKTIDGGESWTNADPLGSLHNLPVNDIAYQKGSDDMIYIGTDAGIYYKDNSMEKWRRMCHFPNVRVTELRINYCLSKLRASTFGRGIWEGDLVAHTRDLGNAPRVIGVEEYWPESRGIDRDIRIPKGHRLIVEGGEKTMRLSLPAKGRIILEDGAHLTVKNALLTNGCGAKWRGIVWEREDERNPPKIQFNNVQLSKIE